MSHIPSELFPEILKRLPAQSLLRFRIVCKSWRHIIDDPCFIRSHSIAQHSTNFLLWNKWGTGIFSFSWDSLHYNHASSQRIQITPIKILSSLRDPKVASCNGLFLISHNYNWVIWNPLMREFHTVPEPEPNPKILQWFDERAFGYDPVGDDYKVVMICYDVNNGNKYFHTLVYSLKQDSWNKIQDLNAVFGCEVYQNRSLVYLNGSLYFAKKNSIIALNLGTEDYRVLSLPPLSDENVELSVVDGDRVKLSVLD